MKHLDIFLNDTYFSTWSDSTSQMEPDSMVVGFLFGTRVFALEGTYGRASSTSPPFSSTYRLQSVDTPFLFLNCSLGLQNWFTAVLGGGGSVAMHSLWFKGVDYYYHASIDL